MRRMLRLGVGLAVLAPLAATAAGCIAALFVGAGVGALAVAYVAGEGQQAFAEPMEKTRQAVIAVMDEMSFSIIEKSGDAADAKVVGLTSERHEVKVHLSRESDKVTMVTIRVGTMGNERLTRLLFEKINDRLNRK